MNKFTPLVGLLLATSTPAWADDSLSNTQQIEILQKQIDQLKTDVKEDKKAISSLKPKIKIGGAVRFQYSYEDYQGNDANQDRGGDMDFDVFRLDVSGSIGDVKLSAQYRWYQYMDVIHHADVSYQFTDNWEGKVGITQVPFGNLSYNSNSFFFSSGFYTGLEDDFDSGLNMIGKYDKHDIRIAYFLNDELGGVDGYVSDRTARYSYDVTGFKDTNNDLVGMGEANTFNLRYAYSIAANTEVGVSLQTGDLEGAGGVGSVGDNTAYAFHVKSKIDNIGIMFQYSDYEYDLDSQAESVQVGAYGFNDYIPSEASSYNLNLSYSQSVSLGPITNLTYYNDYNLVTNKSGGFDDTTMNVTGVAISAGGVYAYVDFIIAKNQPFIGGTLVGDADDYNRRLNINIGYYF
jgi:hypothetical protein